MPIVERSFGINTTNEGAILEPIAQIIKGDEGMVKDVIGRLSEEKPATIEAALEVLLHLDVKGGIEKVRELASHKNDDIRSRAFRVCGKSGKGNSDIVRDFPDGVAPRTVLSLSDDSATVLDIRKFSPGSARAHLPAIGP